MSAGRASPAAISISICSAAVISAGPRVSICPKVLCFAPLQLKLASVLEEDRMSLLRHCSRSSRFLWAFALIAILSPSSAAQQAAAATGKALTVERIYSQPSLSGRLTRGLVWTPDGKALSYFETKGSGKEARTELWVMDAASGERRLLVASDKLESILPVDTSRPTQATGLGRRAPSQYQWAPDGAGILFQGPTALAWLDVKSQTGRTLVSGKATLVDPKISPDGRNVSFVRDHNLWLVNLADGKERAITQGGTEEIRKGELDWVYPEELEIKAVYWWSPDSAAISSSSKTANACCGRASEAAIATSISMILKGNSSRRSPRATGMSRRWTRLTNPRASSMSRPRKNLLWNATSTASPWTEPASLGSPRTKARTPRFLHQTLLLSTTPIRTPRHRRAKTSTAPMDRASPRLAKTK